MSGWTIGDDRGGNGASCFTSTDNNKDAMRWDPGEPDVSSSSDDDIASMQNGEIYDDQEDETSESLLFNDEEMKSWSGEQAVLWIAKAANLFEVFGLRAKPCVNRHLLRARFRRLSLLVHPDKNSSDEASSCFQRVSAAFTVLSDEVSQRKLLCELFPQEYEVIHDADEVFGWDRQTSSQRRAARKKAARCTSALSTKEQAAAAAELERARAAKEKEACDVVKARFANRRSLDALAPSKRARRRGNRESSPLPQGLAGSPMVACDPSLSGAKQSPSSAAGAADGVNAVCAPPIVRVNSPVVAAAGECADPNHLWRDHGPEVVNAAGWKRVESRGFPGRFYFVHLATGRTALASEATSQLAKPTESTSPERVEPVSDNEALPHGWERRESRRQPGVFYYVHLQSGESRLDRPSRRASVCFAVRPAVGFVPVHHSGC
eukprot:TRINITY_DN49291_c0_g1_i1.p1 TRINITY_DN49291_c0_g1~~TRINITY_DN49291_c0_g1_i1.p1  ORF type:complete len:435 (-),score=74.99 TRINITY_DN49291_c0_g1_i1:359-1663(-)